MQSPKLHHERAYSALARGTCSPHVTGVVSTEPGVVLGSQVFGPPPTTHYSLPTTHPLRFPTYHRPHAIHWFRG